MTTYTISAWLYMHAHDTWLREADRTVTAKGVTEALAQTLAHGLSYANRGHGYVVQVTSKWHTEQAAMTYAPHFYGVKDLPHGYTHTTRDGLWQIWREDEMVCNERSIGAAYTEAHRHNFRVAMWRDLIGRPTWVPAFSAGMQSYLIDKYAGGTVYHG